MGETTQAKPFVTSGQLIGAFAVLIVAGIAVFFAMRTIDRDAGGGAANVATPAKNPIDTYPIPAYAAPKPRVDYAAEKARYERDREALRKAAPKSEADAVKTLGRAPDNVTEAPGSKTGFLHWYYQTQEIRRDVIQLTYQDGKITAMSL